MQRPKEHRSSCYRCGRTVAATTGTTVYRRRTAADPVTLVRPLLCHGCPPPASGAAWGREERPVAAWLARAGAHCQPVHAPRVQQGAVAVQPVQADERWVKRVGQRVGLALALAVPARLGLGG